MTRVPVADRLQKAYSIVLPMDSVGERAQDEMMAWCLQVALKRVEAIVSNQRRGSYDKAAILAAACAEVLQLRGNGKRAQAFVDSLRNRFPKHTAFQKELRNAAQRLAESLH